MKNPKVMEVLSSAPVDTLTEGLEEIVSDLLNPVAEWAITGNKPEYELDQIIEDGVVGVLTALIAKGGSKVLKSVLGKRKGAGQVTDNTEGQPYQDPLVREIWRVFGGDRAAEQSHREDSSILGQEKTRVEGLEEKDGGQIDAVGDTIIKEENPVKEGDGHVEERKESRSRFLSRLSDEGFTSRASKREGDGGTVAYGYKNVFSQGCPREIWQGLNELGIPAFTMDGTLWMNQNGISRCYDVQEAVAIPGVGVFTNAKTTISPKQVTGHEAFHFWRGTEARTVYVEILRDNLDFGSQSFRDYVDSFEWFYFKGEKADIFDEKQRKLFLEELFAYISGDIHEGTKDAQLAPMFRNFAEVKAAWEAFVRESQKENRTKGQFY